MTERIFYVKPSITQREIEAAGFAALDGWGSNSNLYIDKFEKIFAEVIGVPFAIATSSCTGALELGLAALGIGPGDEVILADTNWVATLAPIVHRGATPVFVDILCDTWCLDPNQVAASITPKTKAIVATHLYGNLADLDRLSAIAKKFNLYLIEDSAEAIGSFYHGAHAGTIGDFGVFSFHGSKTVTTGEGGMLVTSDVNLAKRVRQLNNHGRSTEEKKQFFSAELGYKFKMSNLQAAIGVAQMERFDELVFRKREILDIYRERLSEFEAIQINPIQPGCTSGAWMPNVTFSKDSRVTRELLMDAFRRDNIDARVFFWPLTSMNLHGISQRVSPNSDSIASRSINLPSYHDMNSVEIDRVVNVLVRLATVG